MHFCIISNIRMKALIDYFIKRPVVANVVMFGMILSIFLSWYQIGKEEMPEFSMNFVSINLPYPGASAEDVELFVSRPIEEKLKGITGLDEVTTTSSYGRCSIRVMFEPSITNLPEKIQEVKDAVDSAQLPQEVEEPIYRQFRSSEKAIVDIGIYLKDVEMLDVSSRIQLQKYALAFKDQLLSLKSVSGVQSSGYLKPELQIKIYPEKLQKYELSMNQVKEQIVQQHVRRPIGSMMDLAESEITIISELNSIESLQEVIVTSGFQGQKIKLSDIARIEHGFEKSTTVTKIQGHEGVIFEVQKSASTDILTAQKEIVNFIKSFEQKDLPVNFILMDDESYDVRNRLSLITTNGALGFILIITVLFLFLDFRSGIWVAMGIPFSLAFTLIVSLLLGYTVNNMTLAAIIIVLGIVVDDAIIVAENIGRKKELGITPQNATLEVWGPIIASVLTTCVAFVPLYFFAGRFGLFVKYIPAVIFAMLGASLLESLLILPGHMAHPLPFEHKIRKFGNFAERRQQFINKIEAKYAAFLKKLLPQRLWVLVSFALLLILSVFLFSNCMKYVMFPREEVQEFRLKLIGPADTNRHEMARLSGRVEKMLLTDQYQVVTAVRTSIGQNRRGGEVRENEANLLVEIIPPAERKIPLNKLMIHWQKQLDEMKEFTEYQFQRNRFGSDSGSPIAIEIRENNDEARMKVARQLEQELSQMNNLLANVELERPVTRREFRFNLKKKEISALDINYSQLSSTLRAYIEGDILYTLNNGEEEVDVRFTSADQNKDDISKLLNLTVSNRENYLVPIGGLIDLVPGTRPANIQRINYKKAITLYADLAPESNSTPLLIAQKLEKELFPRIIQGNPSTILNFRGEVEDSRESQADFTLSLVMVLMMVYILLVFLFNSIWTPILISLIIPFGVVGVILSFMAHGMLQYGFFAVVGTLGMIGVVINDSIVLTDKLETSLPNQQYDRTSLFDQIANITASRLRAVVVTTLTTVAGLFPTAYGLGGYDSMLSEMMLAMGHGLLFGMLITLILAPCLYSYYWQIKTAKRTK